MWNRYPKKRSLLDPPRPLSPRITSEILHLGRVATERDNELLARIEHLEHVIAEMGDHFTRELAERDARIAKIEDYLRKQHQTFGARVDARISKKPEPLH
jgi:hypothetical protein